MVNKRWIAACAALCACAVLAGSLPAAAEERRLGDYIYVPQMQISPVSGAISLRVEGLTLDSQSDAPQTAHSLAGAEFGVYVFSGSGELTPWANPLYPSEPMRIRTGEGETRFSLPQGAEYYLRQESAPQGYLFDDEALIPVTGDEIVVRNAMAGQLLISAVDSLGTAIAGVQLEVLGDDGERHLLTTDENGQAVLSCDLEQGYTIAETQLPEGVFAALSVSGGQATEQGVYASVTPANRTRVTFEHPASGSVLLDMKLALLDDNAQTSSVPLEGVRLDILSDPMISVVTDAQGQARASLLEGMYDVHLSYEGEKDVLLPLSEGQMIVSSGATTVIELTAVQPSGRVVLLSSCEKPVSGGSVVLLSEESGRTYGPYALDAEGMAVTEPLSAGGYRIAELTIDDAVQFGAITSEGVSAQNPGDLLLTVRAGEVTQVSLELLTRESQTFALTIESLDEQGMLVQSALDASVRLELLDADGQAVAQMDAAQGGVTVEALSGVYTLRMEEADAARLGVQSVSEAFVLPSAQETVPFVADHTRLILSSVNEEGEIVAGAVYQLTDSAGARHEVVCDEDGMAVTPLLMPGEVTIETLDAPAGHAAAPAVIVTALPGEAAAAEIMHESHGSAVLHVRRMSLDENGEEAYAPVAGAGVRLYRVAKDGRLTDAGVTLTTDEQGQAVISLEAGEYAADLDEQTLAEDMRMPQAVRFAVANTQRADAELICPDSLGGVRVSLIGGAPEDDELAQVRFELINTDGKKTEMTLSGGTFYAGSLAEGEYTLHQTQIPQGYTRAADRQVTVAGGLVSAVEVPLEEYAVVTVSKTGLTFDNALKTYVVPLSGQYGVYTLEDGEMKPYPDAENQATFWANVTPQEIAAGKAASAKLPASIEGTTYYLHELTSAPGFAADETYYEVVLRAGEQMTLDCAVSSDRGFFRFDALDASDLAHVSGGSYALIDADSEEVLLSFDMGDQAYQNAMAIPVGRYILRQTKAAAGYALSSPAELEVVVEPYLTEGGTVTHAQMIAARVPQSAELALIEDMYAATQQGLTLLSVETGSLGGGERLLAPTLTIELGAAGSERSDIASVVITGAGDTSGGAYRARIEYCLDGGGWQPSDARMTDVLAGPTAVSLDDVRDDIRAVRVTYIDAQTGEEAVAGGFTPGQVTLSVEASAQGDVNMQARAAFEGAFVYATEFGGRTQTLLRSAQAQLPFVMQANGLFDTVSAGRDGRISGVAFFDEDTDGVMDGTETDRYVGLTVSLMSRSGDVLETVRTGVDGSYSFDTISSGEYVVQFDGGEGMVFSSGSLLSSHVISGIEDMRYGASPVMTIDGDHTDYVVNVGCIFAAEITGEVLEGVEGNEQIGFSGLSIEMRASDAAEDDEPLVVVTGGMGEFQFNRVLPGTYEITMTLPQGYLCRDAQDGQIVRMVELAAGDSVSFGTILLEKAAAVAGVVRVDDDADGVIKDDAAVLEDIRVVLLSTKDGYTERIAETVTDAEGAYVFDSLYPGEYSVLFELGGDWAFTRYGDDSSVYGAVSQSGATHRFTLEPGQVMTGVNAGVTLPAELTVMVFKDTQFDGQKGAYEEMLAGVSISLIRLEGGADAEAVTYTTDETGAIVFAGMSPGEYVIAYELPGQWRATKQVESANYPVSIVPQSMTSTGRSQPFALTMGESGTKLYIGAVLSGSVAGTAYYDDDADAKRDEGEAACEGVIAELLAVSGETVASMITDQSGAYLFEGVAPGRYTVRFTAQEGCGFSGTERTAARGGVLESDTNVSSTRTISVSSGQAVASADAGVVRLGSISGLIWEDQDGDRAPGSAENAMSGVDVHLMDGAGRNILRTVQTDETGRFVFDSLKPGNYKLRMDAPEGYVFSGEQEGGVLPLENERDGRGYSAAFALLGGVHVQDIGFGLLTQGSISGMVWEDADYDGMLESGEPGLRGVNVVLLDAQGSEVASRQTIRSGEFTFDQLMPGEYALAVMLDSGYAFTADGGDSLAAHDAQDGAVVSLGTLEMGGSIADVRIGALKKASVGGVVWYDQNDDGRRENGDAGMQGVRVLLEMTDGADSGKVFETATDETGAYRFDGVMPGEAKLTFEIEDGYAFAKAVSGTRRVSSVPKTDALTASTDALSIKTGESRMDIDVGVVGVGTVSGMIWEDSAYDGRFGDGETGVSGALVELVEAASGWTAASAESDENGAYAIGFARKGEYRVRVTLPDGRIFTRSGESAIADVDAHEAETDAFALAMGESVQALDVGSIVPAVIEGRVVVDANENGVCEDGEAGLEGAAVTAMQGGTMVATVYADETGRFVFDSLRPGTYRLRYVLSEDALFARGAALNMTDEDALEAETSEYALEMGQQESTAAVPVVLAGRIAGRAFMDEDVSGAMDAGEPALPGVIAKLLDGSGAEIASVQTGSDGSYAFNALRSGEYRVQFVLPDGVLFTDYTGNTGDSSVPVVAGSTGETPAYALGMGEQKLDMNVGGIQPGRIGDTIWHDENGNGLQDYKEPLLAGVSLTLLSVGTDGETTVCAQTVSDQYGYYAFDALRPGTYVLRLDAQAGDTLTMHFGEPLGEIDSDLNPDTGMSEPIALRSGQTLRNIDVGLTEHAE